MGAGRLGENRKTLVRSLSLASLGGPLYHPPTMTLSERLKQHLAEFGSLALAVYLTLFVVVLIGFAIGIQTGLKVEGVAEGATLFGAAWVATKLTQPIRILATLAITPVVAAVVRKVRGPRPEEPADDGR